MTKFEKAKAYRDAINDARIREIRYPVALQGHCAGCGVGIPVGFLALVMKYEPVTWGTTSQKLSVMRPVEMYCRRCPQSGVIAGEAPSRHRRTTVVEAVADLPVKEVAARLYAKCTQGKARTARRLAKKAGIEYGPVVPMVLKKLTEAKKLIQVDEEGQEKWRLP